MIVLASDHAGVALKVVLKAALHADGWSVLDLGPDAAVPPVDYPDYADRVATVIATGQASFGVLLCGSGIGMSIAANRHRPVRAALCGTVEMARLARQHNAANVLVLGARMIPDDRAVDCLRVFLETSFEEGRHLARVAKIS